MCACASGFEGEQCQASSSDPFFSGTTMYAIIGAAAGVLLLLLLLLSCLVHRAQVRRTTHIVLSYSQVTDAMLVRQLREQLQNYSLTGSSGKSFSGLYEEEEEKKNSETHDSICLHGHTVSCRENFSSTTLATKQNLHALKHTCVICPVLSEQVRSACFGEVSSFSGFFCLFKFVPFAVSFLLRLLLLLLLLIDRRWPSCRTRDRCAAMRGAG